MKFRCERDALLDALSMASRAVSSRGGALPVLSGVRIEVAGEQVTICGTDLDLTITAAIAVAGEEDGVSVVPAKLAVDIIRSLESGSVEVTAGGSEATISGGRSQFTLHVLPAEEFPKVSSAEGEPLQFDVADFAGALRQVVPAASTDDSRPILTGVLMAAEADGLRLVATDSYRLAVRDLPSASLLEAGQSVLVPSRALTEVARIVGTASSLELVLDTREATFIVGDTRITTRLIEGDFPNYRGLIPQHQPNRLTIARGPLIEALRRVKLLAREATPVRLSMSSDTLSLIAITQDVGQAREELDAKYEGTELTVAFNPEYLLQGLEVSGGDEITLETVDALKPAVVRSVDLEEFLYLLMPVRVS